MEKAFKEDIAQLKSDTPSLEARMETLEHRFADALPTISMLQTRCNAQDQKVKTLLCQLDDFENRIRRETYASVAYQKPWLLRILSPN